MVSAAGLAIGSTIVSWYSVAQAAIVVYGIYNGIRAGKEARRAKDAAAKPQTAQGDSTDLPRTIAYGRVEVSGRDAKVVGATDDNRFYWIVRALTPDHEIDAVEDVLLDGVAAGPFQQSLLLGSDVASSSVFNKRKNITATYNGVWGAGLVITAPGPIQRILTFHVAETSAVSIEYRPMTRGDEPGGYFGDDGSNMSTGDPADVSFSGAVISVPTYAYDRAVLITYVYEQITPHVWVKAYLGTESQTVCSELNAADPSWNENCRLRGVPYLVIRLVPDLDIFQSGPPRASAVIRGKKIYDPRSSTYAWSANVALQVYDQLINEVKATAEEVDQNLLIAAANACDEAMTNETRSYYVPSDSGDVLAPAYGTKRYEGHYNASTEASPLENIKVLLAAMAGTLTFAGSTFDLRAGVAQTAGALLDAGALDSSDLADGNWEQQPFMPTLDTFNAVRGRHVLLEYKPTRFAVTDFPSYASPFYAVEDQGNIKWEEMDLTAVQNPYQAQRIAKIRLHLSRNALTFRANWKLSACPFSAGEIVSVTMPNLGQTDKIFQIIKRGMPDSNKVSLLMQELPNAVYAWDYNEAYAPDPAPNTDLPLVGQVADVVGLEAVSGPEVADYGPNGIVSGVIRVRWSMTIDFNVLYGGRVDIWYKKSNQQEWTKIRLPGDSTRFDIPVIRGEMFAIQVRNSNGIASGNWSIITHQAINAPTPYLTGNLLPMAVPVFEYDGALNASVLSPGGWKDVYWFGTNQSTKYGQLQLNRAGVISYGFASVVNPPSGESVTSGLAESYEVPMGAGQRVVAFTTAISDERKRHYCFVRCYNNSGTFISDIAQSAYAPEYQSETIGGMREVLGGMCWGFGETPAGTASVSFCVVTTVESQQTLPAFIAFYRPYLGRASAGQVTLPPWLS